MLLMSQLQDGMVLMTIQWLDELKRFSATMFLHICT